MIRYCVFLLLFIGFPFPLAAQWFVNPNYLVAQFNPFSSCQRPSTYAERMFTEVLMHAREFAEIPGMFFCKNDFVPNAYAQSYPVVWNGQRRREFRIDYNPNFMGMADVSVNNRFALQGVLAHEIGHIEHFASLANPNNLNAWKDNLDLHVPWEKELRADEFAGFVLGRMGASVNDVVDVQRTIFSLHLTSEYADSRTRLRRMLEGYRRTQGDITQLDINEIVEAQERLAEQYLRWR